MRIPALGEDSREISVQIRLSLQGEGQRFRYRRGSKAAPWGADRLPDIRKGAEVVIVEGFSDYATGRLHGLPVYALPGASGWKEQRDAPVLERLNIFVVIEPDQGGQALTEKLGSSRLRDQIRVVTLDQYKDLSELHVADPDQFTARWAAAKARARPLTAVQAEAAENERRELEPQVQHLAQRPFILDLRTAE